MCEEELYIASFKLLHSHITLILFLVLYKKVELNKVAIKFWDIINIFCRVKLAADMIIVVL